MRRCINNVLLCIAAISINDNPVIDLCGIKMPLSRTYFTIVYELHIIKYSNNVKPE